MKLSDKKRLDILSAAEQLFFQHGVAHTSMDQVASVAGVSKRTVYNHFSAKEDLFYAILQRMREQIGDTDIVQFSAAQALDQQLRNIALQEAALLTSDNFLRIARIAFMQMLQQPDLARQLSSNKFGCMLYLESFLTDAVKAGALKIDDVALAAKQFVYQIKSFVFYPHLYGFEVLNKQQECEVIDATVAMFLARYRA